MGGLYIRGLIDAAFQYVKIKINTCAENRSLPSFSLSFLFFDIVRSGCAVFKMNTDGNWGYLLVESCCLIVFVIGIFHCLCCKKKKKSSHINGIDDGEWKDPVRKKLTYEESLSEKDELPNEAKENLPGKEELEKNKDSSSEAKEKLQEKESKCKMRKNKPNLRVKRAWVETPGT